jgi:hypothetical protein
MPAATTVANRASFIDSLQPHELLAGLKKAGT